MDMNVITLWFRKYLNFSTLIRLCCVAILGFTSSLYAAPKQIPFVDSQITIFPSGYENGARNECVKDSTDLNSLTCTANDVQLAEITVPHGEPTTCRAGEIVTQNLSFKVVSTASIRYNWSFYTTTDPNASPLEGPPSDVTNREACLVWVGDLTGGNSTAQNANGDSCADVTKNNDALYNNEEITFVCADTDGDTQVDLQFCATWEQNAGGSCEADSGGIDPNKLPLPGAPSKCNCSTATIPITVLPSDPELTKSIFGPASRPEDDIFNGSNTFTFDLKIKNPNTATPLVITSLTDSFGGANFSIPTDIDASPGTLIEDQVVLISATDNDGTCLASGSETVAPGATYNCRATFKWHNLDLDDTILVDTIVREDKQNSFQGEWKFGNESPTPTEVSNTVTVSITDVPPVLTVTKTANKTSIPESGGANFDLINYTVTFGNASGWDTIQIFANDLDDTLMQNGANSKSGYLKTCSISGLDLGENPKCYYPVNLATEYPTLNAGDIYKNTVSAIPTDEEGTSGTLKDHMVNVNVTNVNPTVSLTKYVKAGGAPASPNTLDPSLYSDTSASVNEFELADITNAPIVTYLFEITNTSPETVNITDFVDFASANGSFSTTPPSQVFDNNIPDTNPVAGDCNTLVGRSMVAGSSEYCYLTFKVKGDESEDVDNIAWVLVQDTDSAQGKAFATDAAIVYIDPVTPDFALDLGVQLKINVAVTADTGNTEYVLFTPTSDILLSNVAILDGGYANDNPAFTVQNLDCSSSEQSLGPDESYNCDFTVTLTGNFGATALGNLSATVLKVQAKDNDGSVQFIDAQATVQIVD
ncbi:hypothetical protein VIN01S_12120 [Vibrio inusitatus NBRC 102082]|uniref:Uncharacterized protein n=1 Tax=Vibrio inusitatus NBRC 102082 TaxID=1219070 RepID=A0A4Y3HTM8_9VIBR|nr:hypothetical protein [Vibrio inusitatus]GEA50408.1 hypothetical protein VIN01S_12120 [Vibrio inusitatus NBRC 102082]